MPGSRGFRAIPRGPLHPAGRVVAQGHQQLQPPRPDLVGAWVAPRPEGGVRPAPVFPRLGARVRVSINRSGVEFDRDQVRCAAGFHRGFHLLRVSARGLLVFFECLNYVAPTRVRARREFGDPQPTCPGATGVRHGGVSFGFYKGIVVIAPTFEKLATDFKRPLAIAALSSRSRLRDVRLATEFR